MIHFIFYTHIAKVRRIVAKALPPELGSYFNRMGSDVHLGLSVDVAEEVSKESRGDHLSLSMGVFGVLSVLTGVLFLRIVLS
jgi:hypothetical protein